MTKENVFLRGGGWISSEAYGSLAARPRFSVDSIAFQYPDLKSTLDELPARFGRFDTYTRLVFSSAVLALSDAGMLGRDDLKDVGVIVASRGECYDMDSEYYETTIDGAGEFTSPNLFSYTLPNVVLGEIAVYFRFTGPTFCTGNEKGAEGAAALDAAYAMLRAGRTKRVLVSFCESAERLSDTKDFPKGAQCVVLSTEKRDTHKRSYTFENAPRRLSDFWE